MYGENYYGYTFPENIMFGDDTMEFVNALWSRWIKGKISEVHSFLKLNWSHSPARLNKACKRALFYKCISTSAVRNILDRNLEKLPLSEHTDVEGQLIFDF
jgi:hypothetical protein